MTTTSNPPTPQALTEDRIKLLYNGYTPLPGVDKACRLYKWQEYQPTEAKLRELSRSTKYLATNLRLEDGIVFIDIDIPDAQLSAGMQALLKKALPAVAAHGLRRLGSAAKLAVLVQLDPNDAPFFRMQTRKFAGENRVEIFASSPKGKKQFGVFGYHTEPHNKEGKPALLYRWDGPSPLEVPRAQLQVVTRAELKAFIDKADAWLAAQGLEPIPETHAGLTEPTHQYIQFAGLRIDTNDGRRINGEDLKDEQLAAAHDGRSLRCASSFLPNDRGQNREKCSIGFSERRDSVYIHNYETSTTYWPAELLERDPLEYLAELLRERQDAGIHDFEPFPPAPTGDMQTDHNNALMWLSQHWALYAGLLVPLRDPNPPEPRGLAAMKTVLARYDLVIPGRTKPTRISPLGKWLTSPHYLTEVSGWEIMPGQPWPLTGGKINLYRPPRFPAGGDHGPFLDLMDHLIAYDEEHEYVLQLMAHKVLHPETPGITPLFVTQTEGTGRNTLFHIECLMHGTEYCYENLPFTQLAGLNQGQFNTHQARLIATVSEVAAPEMTKHRQQREIHARLKETLESSERQIVLNDKNIRHRSITTHTSYRIATNDAKAFPLKASDRRLAVITCTDQRMPAKLSNLLYAWMEDRANLGAVYRYLRSIADPAFNPHFAPQTVGHEEMQEAAKTSIDRRVEAALAILPGDIYTRELVVEVMQAQSSFSSRITPADIAIVESNILDYLAVLPRAAGGRVMYKGVAYQSLLTKQGRRFAYETMKNQREVRRQLVINLEALEQLKKRGAGPIVIQDVADDENDDDEGDVT